ncbi:hypothetical protein H0H93_005278 [Arthromyces matolae]|nr:hypothetical protein H0H93_005278 [Arthromyces matolae]
MTFAGSGRPNSKPNIIERLGNIDVDTPSTSILRAAKKIRKEAQTADATTRKRLLESTERVESLLGPMSEALEHERVAHAMTKGEMNVLKRKLEQMDSSSTTIRLLETQLAAANEELQITLSSNKKSKEKFRREKEETARLQKSNERFQRALDKQKEDTAEVEAALQESNNQLNVLKKKLRILSKNSSKPALRESNPDDSLQILSSDREYESAVVGGHHNDKKRIIKRRLRVA